MTITDETDLRLVHALHVDGRASFRHIAQVLGVSVQTVTRRYHRLRTDFGLRVVGLPTPHAMTAVQWLVRLHAAPKISGELARALARRSDTSWVRLLSGGTEICALVRTPLHTEHALLLTDLPRTTGLTAVSAQAVLHTYRGGPTAWLGRPHVLTADEIAALTPQHQPTEHRPAEADPIFAVLAQDGRASVRHLAQACGVSAATATRRLAELRAADAVFFDVQLAPAALGAGVQVLLWLDVAPSALEQVAAEIAEHAEIAYLAATTGTTSLVANVLCADLAALHQYLTRRVRAYAGVRHLESAPVLRTLKVAA